MSVAWAEAPKAGILSWIAKGPRSLGSKAAAAVSSEIATLRTAGWKGASRLYRDRLSSFAGNNYGMADVNLFSGIDMAAHADKLCTLRTLYMDVLPNAADEFAVYVVAPFAIRAAPAMARKYSPAIHAFATRARETLVSVAEGVREATGRVYRPSPGFAGAAFAAAMAACVVIHRDDAGLSPIAPVRAGFVAASPGSLPTLIV